MTPRYPVNLFFVHAPQPTFSFSQVQDPTTWTAQAMSAQIAEATALTDIDPGPAYFDFWTPLLPRDERDTLGVENAAIEELAIEFNIMANAMPDNITFKLDVVPYLHLDPVMSTTHPGISKANLGYRQSNNEFRRMIEEL